MKTSSVITKEVNHIYEAYNLYGVTYSRNPSYKLGEALGVLSFMSYLKAMDPLEFSSFRVLELMAGKNSEHRKFVLDNADHFKDICIEKYSYLDNIKSDEAKEKDPNKLSSGDILELDAPGFNFIMALFYSASGVMDLSGKHSSLHARSVCKQLYISVYNNLPDGGVFYLDYPMNGYYSSMGIISGEHECTYSIPEFHPLRQEFNIPAGRVAFAKLTLTITYDRLSSTVYENFVKPVRIYYVEHNDPDNQILVGKVKVREPLSQRYFGEPELTDMALEAGFSQILFLKNDYLSNEYEILDNYISLAEGENQGNEDIETTLMGNVIVAIK